MVVVAVQERGQRRRPLVVAEPGLRVEALLRQGPVEPLDLAVRLRPIRLGVLVLDTITQRVVESPGAVAHKRSIVALGHKMLRTIYAMLSKNTHYVDKTVDYEALIR